MNELHKALGEISSIRLQVARSTEFRGYGPATLATTSVFAMVAAAVQARWATDAAYHITRYLTIWIATAVVSAALTGVQVYRRTQREHSGLSDEMIRMAVEQFLPSAAAGLLITIVLVGAVPGVLWMLPGAAPVAAADGGGGRVVSADGDGGDRAGRRASIFSLGDGRSVWSRPDAGGGNPAVDRAGGRA